MNDDELKRLLQNSLAGRRAPDEVKARVLGRLRRPPVLGLALAGVAAAAVVLVAGAAARVLFKPAPGLPEHVQQAFTQHAFSDVKEHAIVSATIRDITATLREVTGREVQLPGLRDAGFTQLEAHHCEGTRTAHVVFQNSWNKLSCFIYEAEKFPLERGERLAQSSGEAYVFTDGQTSGVAVREGGIVKFWVSDLRSQQVAAIAIDAEQKRYTLRTTVLAAETPVVFGPMGDLLTAMPGVEDVQVVQEESECHIRFDPRRVTTDEILRVFQQHDFEVNVKER